MSRGGRYEIPAFKVFYIHLEFFIKSCLIKKVKLWKFKLDEFRRNRVKH